MVSNGSLAQRAASMLREHGIHSARLISEDMPGHDPMSDVATFDLDGLLLRFVRERTEEFIDIGTQAHANEFHQFDDVAIALGWTSVDAVLDKQAPESLSAVLSQISQYLPTLRAELAGPHIEWTRKRIERANADRAKALERRLR